MTQVSTKAEGAAQVPDLIIEEVHDDDGVRLFERVRQAADVYPPEYDPAPGRFFDVRVLGSGHRMWLGYVNGEPVATAAAFESGNLNLIKNVNTAASHMRRGLVKP